LRHFIYYSKQILSKNLMALKNPFSYLLRRSGRKHSGTSNKVKDPDASIRGIKLAAMQASGYQTPAAGLRSTPVGAKRVPLAHSTAKWTCQHVRLARCPRK